MPSIKIIRIFILILSTVIAVMASANESAAPAEAGGEGGGEAAAPATPSNAEFVEYSKRLNKMTQLQTRIKDDKQRLEELIHLKNGGAQVIKDDKNNSNKVTDLIVRQHGELEKGYIQYNEELREITYRFPSKGEEIRRKYIPLRPKTLEQVEKEMGLDGELTALKSKVDDKYRAFAPPEEPVPTPMPSKVESTLIDKNAEKPHRLKLKK